MAGTRELSAVVGAHRAGAQHHDFHRGDAPSAHRETAAGSSSTIFVPSTWRNLAIHAGWAGHAGAVTRLPSATAWSMPISASTRRARLTSGATAGEAETARAFTTPAAGRVCAPSPR